MIDLIKILIFLTGSAALGFFLGRRSRNSDIAVRDHQVEEQRRAYVEVKNKLDRCTAKRAGLERDMAQLQQAKPPGKETIAKSSTATRPAKTAPPKAKESPKSPTKPSAKPTAPTSSKSDSRPKTEAKAKAPVPPQPKAKKETKSASAKQNEAIARVKAKAEQIDFNRIGKASEVEKDDLKKIKGVGPFLEKKLNALGIYTFAQIANFTDQDKEVVNDAIEFFPGRISRDDWVGQAKNLQQKT
jgi:predicted flap endonuclease-1-like 5' DNA nuclease